MEPDLAVICPIMDSTGSDGNILGIKNIKVTPIQIVSAHVKRRFKKYVLNFTNDLPFSF